MPEGVVVRRQLSQLSKQKPFQHMPNPQIRRPVVTHGVCIVVSEVTGFLNLAPEGPGPMAVAAP
jgi:hypothetical protein